LSETVFLDTNILIPYLTQDDPDKAARSYAFLQRVEQGIQLATTTEAVVAEAVHVLSSKALYAASRPIIQQRLTAILDLRGLRLRDKSVYRRALELYVAVNVDFVDCLSVARMERAGLARVVSFDTDFDRLPGITRAEPDLAGKLP
jgi:predicted nucleic acid-binding protein